MGTNNFHVENASSPMFVLMNDDDEWFYEDALENITQVIGLEETSCKDRHELRSYPSRVLGKLEKRITVTTGVVANEEEDIRITLLAVARSGYYAGMALDWTVEIHDDYYDFFDYEEWYNYIMEERKFTDERKTDIVREVGDISDELIQKVEEVYELYTEKIRKVGQFSNGEAVYEKITNKKEIK
tara:strand:+ start:424 stop:978 length:555 start_codon:yes stop_codon:yes gene_type:complete